VRFAFGLGQRQAFRPTVEGLEQLLCRALPPLFNIGYFREKIITFVLY
jgi:hypothetical protein